ncbi:MAG: peptidoglycan editing factor PgeF [Leptolyngbyaceae cyanobacterium bins.302]|nr:peptidoglycan editing factor PgeF [Leptolyngbyaceae cyanobacterium bins.302]
MHTWHWQTWNDLPYLTCSILESWQHGFFSLHYAPRSPEELTSILHPAAQTYRIKQVHGNTVLTPTEIAQVTQASEPVLAERPAADALVTEQADQAVWVCSADCTPVLIADGATGQVAAIHAGWRGTALKIVPQTIARMQTQGRQLASLRVAMGPAIAGAVYQVSEAVAAEVGATIAPINATNIANSIAILQDLPQSPILDDPEPGRVRLDVRRVNALQLEQLGLSQEQIAIAPHCTYQDPDNFFSYRRTQQKNVQWSGIVSR